VYPDDHAYMLVVADGVGGEAFGDFASQLALETAFELAGAATSWVMKLTDLNAQQMRARIDAYCQQIQATLRRYGQVVPELRGMATTWTSAYVLPPHVVVTHIGDSRAYQYRGSKLWQITQDQTIAEQLKGAGMPDDAVRQFRHVLTNCLGGQQDEVTAEIYQTTLSETDRLLLCTDGLSDMVAEEEIIRLLSKHNDTQEACDQLIEAALEQGGKDNVTVALCDVGTPSESS
jgi:protein phosphatase